MWFNSENSLFNAEFMPYFLPVNDEYMFTSAVKKMLIQLCVFEDKIYNVAQVLNVWILKFFQLSGV
jgi:hypothetical protein